VPAARLIGKGAVHCQRDAMFFTSTAPCLQRKKAGGDQNNERSLTQPIHNIHKKAPTHTSLTSYARGLGGSERALSKNNGKQ